MTQVYMELNKIKQDEQNYLAWWQGLYIFDALSTVSFNENRGKRQAKNYPEEPYRIRPLTEVEKEAMAERERKKAIASFNALKKAWDLQNGRN